MGVCSETLLSLGAAARLPLIVEVHGKPVNTNSLYRWIAVGIGPADRRVKLEAARIGGKTVTSEEALLRFFERASSTLVWAEKEPKEASTARYSPAAQRTLKAIRQANAIETLREHGIRV